MISGEWSRIYPQKTALFHITAERGWGMGVEGMKAAYMAEGVGWGRWGWWNVVQTTNGRDFSQVFFFFYISLLFLLLWGPFPSTSLLVQCSQAFLSTRCRPHLVVGLLLVKEGAIHLDRASTLACSTRGETLKLSDLDGREREAWRAKVGTVRPSVLQLRGTADAASNLRHHQPLVGPHTENDGARTLQPTLLLGTLKLKVGEGRDCYRAGFVV
jgi:hypothetical protein